MQTLKTKEKELASNPPLINNILGLCKKYKLSIKDVSAAQDTQEGSLVLISVVVNKALMLEADNYFLPMGLVTALNKLSFTTKKFNYSTGFNPKVPRILVLAVNQFPLK